MSSLSTGIVRRMELRGGSWRSKLQLCKESLKRPTPTPHSLVSLQPHHPGPSIARNAPGLEALTPSGAMNCCLLKSFAYHALQDDHIESGANSDRSSLTCSPNLSHDKYSTIRRGLFRRAGTLQCHTLLGWKRRMIESGKS
jgi:hypothetical protein